MAKKQETISSGSGSSYGAPLIVDFKEALAALATDTREDDTWGGTITVSEAAESLPNVGLTTVRIWIRKARDAGDLRFEVRRGVRHYAAQDIYKMARKNLCKPLE